jgi:two-component system sensor histidine kinase and response regulator WspE
MSAPPLADLFRSEFQRLSAQVEPLLATLRTAPEDATAIAGLRRRWLALKSAAGVVQLLWLERLAEACEARLARASQGQAALTQVDLDVLARALRMADPLLSANAEHWTLASDQAAAASQPLLAQLRGQRRERDAPADPTAARMLELLRGEIDEHGAVIQRNLLLLEADAEQTQLLTPIMRAAHAIKGAARAARLDPAVRLSHLMEDHFIAMQRGQLPVHHAGIELYLRANDHLIAMARSAAQGASGEVGAGTAPLIAALEQWSQSGALEVTGDTDGKTPGVHATSANPSSPDVIAPPSLRVHAEPVNQILGMAAQQRVEAGALRSFIAQLREMRIETKQVHEQLEELHQYLGAPDVADPIGARLLALRHRVRSSRVHLSGHTDAFNQFAGASELLSQRMLRTATQIRLRPLADVLIGFPRMLRDLARRLEKRAQWSVKGDEQSVDRDILERIEAPLTQLLRNAIDHGIEPPPERVAAGKPEIGQIRLTISQHAGMLLLEMSDDGRGIDIERIRTRLIERGTRDDEAAQMSRNDLLEVLFLPDFSTASAVTETSGRGVGLDVVRANLHEIGGSVRVSSTLGVSTSFHLLVPVSRSVVRTVVVKVAGERYGFALARIGRVQRIAADLLAAGRTVHFVHVGGINLRLVDLADLLELGQTRMGGTALTAVVIDNQNRPFGFVVDEVMGEFDLSVRPIDARLGRVTDLSAAAVMPDGEAVILVDVDDLLRSAQRQDALAPLQTGTSSATGARRQRILVTDDSISVRELVRQLLVGKGYEVEVAVDGQDAWHKVRDEAFDLLITDIDMPRMDGIELTRSVKQDLRLRQMPVMIVSYRDRPEDRARGLAERADAYVTKSDFQDERFLALVHDLIGAANRETA